MHKYLDVCVIILIQFFYLILKIHADAIMLCVSQSVCKQLGLPWLKYFSTVQITRFFKSFYVKLWFFWLSKFFWLTHFAIFVEKKVNYLLYCINLSITQTFVIFMWQLLEAENAQFLLRYCAVLVRQNSWNGVRIKKISIAYFGLKLVLLFGNHYQLQPKLWNCLKCSVF